MSHGAYDDGLPKALHVIQWTCCAAPHRLQSCEWFNLELQDPPTVAHISWASSNVIFLSYLFFLNCLIWLHLVSWSTGGPYGPIAVEYLLGLLAKLSLPVGVDFAS